MAALLIFLKLKKEEICWALKVCHIKTSPSPQGAYIANREDSEPGNLGSGPHIAWSEERI